MSTSDQGGNEAAGPQGDWVESRVMQILAGRAEADAAGPITRDTPLFELGDSLDTVETLMQLEDEFAISIADDEAERLRTVGQLVDLVRQKAAESKRSAPAT